MTKNTEVAVAAAPARSDAVALPGQIDHERLRREALETLKTGEQGRRVRTAPSRAPPVAVGESWSSHPGKVFSRQSSTALALIGGAPHLADDVDRGPDLRDRSGGAVPV